MDNQSLLAIVAFMSAGLIMGVSGVVNMMTMTGRRKE